jgi:hypothetical protein
VGYGCITITAQSTGEHARRWKLDVITCMAASRFNLNGIPRNLQATYICEMWSSTEHDAQDWRMSARCVTLVADNYFLAAHRERTESTGPRRAAHAGQTPDAPPSLAQKLPEVCVTQARRRRGGATTRCSCRGRSNAWVVPGLLRLPFCCLPKA